MVPMVLENQGILEYTREIFGFDDHTLNYTLKKFTENIENPSAEVTIGLIGKYVDMQDAYISHKEAFSRRFI